MQRQRVHESENEDEDGPPNLTIDRDDLDGELVRHPQMYWEASEASVLAASRRDGMKQSMDQLDASLFKRLRIKLVSKGEKDTDTAVKAAVERHPEHKQAVEDYLESVKAAALAEAFKWAVDQRGKALRELASLYVSNYYAADSARSKSAGEAREALQGENRRRIAEERARRRGGGG